MIADVPNLLRQENSPELQFVPVNEFALKKNNSIRLKLFNDACPECMRFYYIPDGKSDWLINRENYIFYPANLAIILHGHLPDEPKSTTSKAFIRHNFLLARIKTNQIYG